MAAASRARRAPAAVDTASDGCSDSALLTRISEGDLEALGVVYDRHVEAAWRIAVHLSATAEVAEEVVSSVFLDVWQNPEPHDPTPLSTRLVARAMREARRARGG